MDEARLRALKGAEEGSVIVAHEQTEGRGRRGRVWESIKGNLHFTYITYCKASLTIAPHLSFVACVAVGETLRSFLSPINHISYKWPNDILLNEKKVGGLLLETVSLPGKKETCYLIGCGLNLINYPKNARYPTTSFQNEGIYLSLEEVLPGIATSLEHYTSLWKREGFASIHDLWMDRAANLERVITIDLQGKTHEGVFKGIDAEGAGLLLTSQGIARFTAGEVIMGEKPCC